MLNTTMNVTHSSIQSLSCYNPTASKIGRTFALCLIFVVSVAGNIFIGVIVYKTKTMRKPINCLIVNMAMSDLLYTILLFPQSILWLYASGSWLISSGPFGQALCKMFAFLPFFSLSVSIQSLVLIALDRFCAVVFPLRSPLISSRLCPFFILSTWIVAMAILSPYLVAYKLVEVPEGFWCLLMWNEVFGESLSYENYVLAVSIVIYYIPLVLLAILYTVICIKLKIQTVPGVQSVNTRQQRVKRERNVLKMSIAIVLGCAACWLPLRMIWILASFASQDFLRSCGFQIFCIVAFFLFRANCAINPCICFIFSGNYRQALKNLLRCSKIVSNPKR